MSKFMYALAVVFIFAFDSAIASANWPNEPAGAAPLIDNAFNSIPGTGCTNVYSGGDAMIVTDASAPVSPSNVLRQRKNPVTSIGGVALNCGVAGVDRIYGAMVFKLSSDWFGLYNNLNKLTGYFAQQHGNFFRFDLAKLSDNSLHLRAGFNGMNRMGGGNGDNCHLAGQGLYSPWPGECAGVSYGLFPNISDPPVTRDQWHRLEFVAELGTCPTCRDGKLYWWLDGVLLGLYDSFNHAISPFVSWSLTHTWDGNGCPGGMQNCGQPPYPTTDYTYIDHLYLSTFGPGVIQTLFRITTGSLPTAQSGKPYTASLQVSGGKAPYSWTISSGSLLPGLTLNKATGVISGAPTTGGKCDFTVKVLDSNVPAKEATKAFTIVASGTSTIKNGNPLTVNGQKLTANPGMGLVSFEMPQSSAYSLAVYDLSGREVWRHVGSGNAVWNHGGNLKKGVYLVRAEQNGRTMKTKYCHVW